MSSFTFLYRGREYDQSPDEMQETMQRWAAWFKSLAAAGHIKNIGDPLEPTGKVVKGARKLVNDGPFAEAKDIIAGYTVVEAKDLDQAAELAKGCPILEFGGSVEVRPIWVNAV